MTNLKLLLKEAEKMFEKWEIWPLTEPVKNLVTKAYHQGVKDGEKEFDRKFKEAIDDKLSEILLEEGKK